MRIPSGTTDQYIYFVAVDATDYVTRETGLATWTVYRSRNGGTAAAMTTPTINETDSTNMPGVYELLLDEDMTIDSGDDSQEMVFHITHTGMAPVTRTIELYRPKITAGNTLGVASDGDISGNLDGTVATVTTLTGHTPQTGDVYALANGAAGFVAIDTVVDAIKVKTDYLPSATAGAAGGVFIAGTNAATSITTALTANITGNLSGSVGSVTGAVGSVTGAVGSVTGNVGGNVVGSVASVTGAVGSVTGNVGGNVTGSVGSVAAGGITASSIATGAIDADALATDAVAEIADGVWDEAISGHVGAGSTGEALSNATAPTAAAVADAVWDEALSGHLGVGSTGEALNAAGAAGDPWTTALPGAYGAGSAGYIIGNNVDAPISTVDTVVDAIKVKTDYLPSATAGSTGGVFIAGTNAATSVTTALTANITGNLSGSVGSVTGAVGSVTGNVGGNVTGSVGSVTGGINTSGGTITTLDGLDTAQDTQHSTTQSAISALNDVSVTDILTTQMTEAYAADGVAPTLAQALFLIQQKLGDFSIAGTTLTVKKLDGSTTAATYTLDDGTSPTSITRAS